MSFVIPSGKYYILPSPNVIGPRATFASAATPTDTQFSLVNSSLLPSLGTGEQCYLAVDSYGQSREIVLMTANDLATNTITVTRGEFATTPANVFAPSSSFLYFIIPLDQFTFAP